jgi:outer membrane immunogenic protein
VRYFGSGRDLIYIGAAAALALGAGAATADGTRPHPNSGMQGTIDWSGLYLGGQLGGAWSNADWTAQNSNYFDTLGPVVVGVDFDQHPSGVIGGIFAGYNYQSGPWLVGLELSWTAEDLKERNASPYFPQIDTYTTEIDWLTTATGRLGYAWDRWLLVFKGGWAGANVELTMLDKVALIEASKDLWANGWTVGIGAEYMLYEGVSLGLAYDYVALNIGNETVTCPRCGTGRGFGTPVVDGDMEVQSVMARVSFFMPVEGGSILGR